MVLKLKINHFFFFINVRYITDQSLPEKILVHARERSGTE